MTREISDEKIEKYLAITKKALEKARIIAPQDSFLEQIAKDFYDMAQRYHQDALFFRDNGDLVNSFAAVNYAHGWLDAGARLGIFEVGGDHQLFTLAR